MDKNSQENMGKEKYQIADKKENEKVSYLSKLKFNPKDFGLFSWGYFNNIRIVVLFILVLILGGVFSYINVPRNLNPEVEIPIVFVSTALPGANSEDVESLVTIPLEDKIKGLSDIDTLSSTSTEGRSGITIQFFSDVDISKAEIDVQTAVSSVSDLPEDATDPIVNSLDFENQPIWTFSMVSNIDDVSLNKFSQELKDELENLSKIDRVETSGIENQEIQILIRPEIMKAIGVNVFALAQSIQSTISSHPAGSVNSDKNSFAISVDPSVNTIKDLRNLSVNINGTSYLLSDIAVISERPSPGQANAYLIGEDRKTKKAITFNIYRNMSERIDRSFAEAKTLVNEKIQNQEGRFEIKTVYSTAKEIDEQFNSLTRNFSITMGLVFIMLLLFFGIRQALIASLAIPFSFLFSFISMQITDISLNFLSMFSLLISLGLLVDVTIVVVSAITSYYGSGKFSPIEAGLLVWKDLRITLLVTTITTVWAFSPLLLATGIIGEFIRPIPIVVSATLIGSLIVGLFITLPLVVAFLKPAVPKRVKIFLLALFSVSFIGGILAFFIENPLITPIVIVSVIFLLVIYTIRKSFASIFYNFYKKPLTKKFFDSSAKLFGRGVISFEGLSSHYRNIIERVICSKKARVKTLVIVVIFALFSFMLVPAGFVVNEFFPKEDADFIYVGVEFPVGTKLDITKKEALALAERFKNTQGLQSVQVQIGAKIGPDGNVSTGSEPDSVLYTLLLRPEKERSATSIAIAEKLRNEFKNYSQGEVSVVELSGGPPAGADINIKLLGPDLKVLDDYANQIVDYLNNQPGAANITKSIEGGASKIIVVPNRDQLVEDGLKNSDIGSFVRVFTNGFDLDNDVKLEDLSQERDIVLRVDENIQEVSSLGIVTDNENTSIAATGDFKLKANPSKINREDSKRTLSVSASVREGYAPTLVNEELESFANSLNLGSEYSWKTGGANEENEKSIQSILQAMILSFVLILATLVIQLGSYRKSVIVMLVIPLALSGVFIVFALTGTPLSFPALIGVLALFGIVVNNSIILIDKINLNLRSKMSLKDAIADASSSRLEPIALGSATTIIGLIPITLSDPLWRGLGGAIISGLIFSGTIMLFFIPVVYYSWFKNEETLEKRNIE
jgi:multidrug efflux pump subunit AcrB